MPAVVEKHVAVDASSREARGRLASMVTQLLDRWHLSAVEQAQVLGFPRAAAAHSHGIGVASRWPTAATCLTAPVTCWASTSRCGCCSRTTVTSSTAG